VNCKSPFKIGICAVILVVLLRVAIGWHFFYEGVHKFDPRANFSAEGFLGIAKGMTAEFYYWMLPDLDGIQRLELGRVTNENAKEEDVKEGKDKKLTTFIVYETAWKEYFKKYLLQYSPFVENEADAEDVVSMGADKFAEWVKKKVPVTVQENIAEMNATQLAAWAAQYILPVDTAEALGDLAKTPPQLKAWAEHYLPSAVAQDVVKMNAAQLEDWAKKNLPITDISKRDDVVKAKTLVEMKTIFNRYLASLRAGAADIEGEVDAFLKSRERFQENKQTVRNDASFEQERRWNLMMAYRREAGSWTKMLTDMGNGLQSDLGRLANPDLAGQKGHITPAPMKELFPPNPLNAQFTIPTIELTVPPANSYVKSYDLSIKSRMDLMDKAVMFGLTAIGLCMMIGFCNRLACLGGAVFLVNVVLTTWPVPGVYPATPSMVGNYMFVSRDVVELLAMLFLATIPAGRWGGLDYFLWNCGGKQIVWVVCYPFTEHQEDKSKQIPFR
jgi:uncharacterized membrane protein YphA (DoxX/SURF4 family)